MRSGSSVSALPGRWCHISLDHLMLLCKDLLPWSEDLSEELAGRCCLLIIQLRFFFPLARKLGFQTNATHASPPAPCFSSPFFRELPPLTTESKLPRLPSTWRLFWQNK